MITTECGYFSFRHWEAIELRNFAASSKVTFSDFFFLDVLLGSKDDELLAVGYLCDSTPRKQSKSFPQSNFPRLRDQQRIQRVQVLYMKRRQGEFDALF